MWPYICQFVEKLFRETIEPAVKESHAHLSTFCFSKIDLGDKVSTLGFCLKCDHMLFQEGQNRPAAAAAGGMGQLEKGRGLNTQYTEVTDMHSCCTNSFHERFGTEIDLSGLGGGWSGVQK